MSYINKALKKAQRDKDSRYHDYGGVLSGLRERTDRFRGKTLRWAFLAVIASLLAFASYSWFDSNDQSPPAINKDEHEQPPQVPVKKKIASAPVKKRIDKGLNAADAKRIYDKARTFHKSGMMENAKRLYQETLKKDPGFADALNNLGVIFLYEKEYEKARINFEKAIRIRPQHVDPYYNLACVYALRGEKKQGVDHLKRAYSLNREVKKWAEEDADLKNLRGIPEFDEIIRD